MSQEQLQAIIQQLKANPLLEQPEIEAVRAGFEQMASLFPVPADVKCEPVTAGTVEAEWVTAPGAASDRVDPPPARRRLRDRLDQHAPRARRGSRRARPRRASC